MRWAGAVAAALTLVAGALVAPRPAVAAAAPVSIIEDDAALLREGPAMRERTLDDMAALGADAVRIIVLWRDVPGVWPQLDAAVAGAQQRGLDVLLTLTGPAPGGGAPDPAAYGRLVAAAGARYPSVTRWSLWNEPNIPNWLPQSGVVARYRALVKAGTTALAATGHGKDIILIGETAPTTTGTTGPRARRPTSPLAFVRAVLAAGPLPAAVTGWAHHAYTGGGYLSPHHLGPRAALGPARLGVLETALKRARLPIWLTEGGFQTNPPDPFFGVPPATQAAWINELDWIASRRPTVRSVAQYLVRDERARSSFQSGVRYADGQRKPSWDAYRAPLWVARRSATRVAVWGRVRPRGAKLTALQRRAPGADRWTKVAVLHGRTVQRRVAAGPRGSRLRLRLVWTDAAGATHVSRTAAAT
ncbi:hypothetical protein [Baekduia sp. Peel2402]|uniref:hypothetical protein n=1 Tax=Baekduia sp. Peel2402 TaxID=3458296 RepID=UPI00403E7A57